MGGDTHTCIAGVLWLLRMGRIGRIGGLLSLRLSWQKLKTNGDDEDMVMSELLRCPFCGGKASEDSAGVHCKNSSCGLHMLSNCTSEQWNTRHTPEGWQLAPVEPTGRMQVAGLRQRYDEDGTRGVYKAMLTAAPKLGDS